MSTAIAQVPAMRAGSDDGMGPKDTAQRAAPVDLAHLARQSMGDRELEAEVLALFVRQATDLRPQISAAVGEERRRLAHTIKGAAGGVGAFALAAAAQAVEDNPADQSSLQVLDRRIVEAVDFIVALRR